jgi:hypothetical protein
MQTKRLLTFTSATPLLLSQSTKPAEMKKADAGVRVIASTGLTAIVVVCSRAAAAQGAKQTCEQ